MPTDIIASLNQISQIGVEATPGTAVPASRRLQSMGFPLTPNEDIENFRPPGAKVDTGEAINREWGEGSIGDGSGVAYNELPYALASILSKPKTGYPRRLGSNAIARSTTYYLGDFGRPATANGFIYEATATSLTGNDARKGTTGTLEPTWPTAVGATVVDGDITWTNRGADTIDAYEWLFDMLTWEYDEVQTYTIETGDKRTGRSYRAAYAFFTGLTISSARGGSVGIDGDILAHALSDFTLTSGVDESAMVPATPAHLNIYMNDVWDLLGATQLDGNFSCNVAVGDRAGHVWWHGRQRGGPAGRVETAPDVNAQLVQADGSEVDTLVAALRAGNRKYFRYEFKGPEIATNIPHKIELDFAAMIRDNRTLDDEDGVHAATIPMAVVAPPDSGGRALRARVITTLAAL